MKYIKILFPHCNSLSQSKGLNILPCNIQSTERDLKYTEVIIVIRTEYITMSQSASERDKTNLDQMLSSTSCGLLCYSFDRFPWQGTASCKMDLSDLISECCYMDFSKLYPQHLVGCFVIYLIGFPGRGQQGRPD